jgi:hypothetical protein
MPAGYHFALYEAAPASVRRQEDMHLLEVNMNMQSMADLMSIEPKAQLRSTKITVIGGFEKPEFGALHVSGPHDHFLTESLCSIAGRPGSPARAAGGRILEPAVLNHVVRWLRSLQAGTCMT